jgi:signal transduction histidine kinase
MAQLARSWRDALDEERRTLSVARNHRLRQLGTVGELAATVAHEIRNPLAVVRSMLQLAQDGTDHPRVPADHLSRVLLEIDRIDRTIEDLLGLSRVQQADAVEVDLAQVAGDTVRFMVPYATRRGVRLGFEADGPAIVRASNRDLRQVVINLLLNSCQACENGGECRISVSSNHQEGRAAATLSVADNGPGIAEDALGRVFEPFFTTKGSGTGLGLSLCQEVVARFQGRIEIESQQGVGTTVRVTLPRV